VARSRRDLRRTRNEIAGFAPAMDATFRIHALLRFFG
jgi:hypothetical protein